MADEITAAAEAKAAAIDSVVDEFDGLSIQEIGAKIEARRNLKVATAEAAKVHPLTKFALSEKEWQQLKDNILDGGGVTDDRDLATTLLQAIMNDDQAAFWPGLIHLVKSRAKINGTLRALPFGGVSLSGVSAGGGGGSFTGVGPG